MVTKHVSQWLENGASERNLLRFLKNLSGVCSRFVYLPRFRPFFPISRSRPFGLSQPLKPMEWQNFAPRTERRRARECAALNLVSEMWAVIPENEASGTPLTFLTWESHFAERPTFISCRVRLLSENASQGIVLSVQKCVWPLRTYVLLCSLEFQFFFLVRIRSMHVRVLLDWKYTWLVGTAFAE